MGCSNLTSGLINNCSSNQGGLESIFIANGPVESFTESAGLITEIIVAGVALVPTDFYEFQVPRQTSSISEEETGDVNQGSVVYAQTASIILKELKASTREQLELMFKATSMIVIGKDNNGSYWTIGLKRGAYGVGATTTSGVEYTTRSGYEITIEGYEADPMYQIEGVVVESIPILPIASYTSNKQTVEVGQSIQFTDTSTVPNGGPPITDTLWMFPGGTPNLVSNDLNPSIQYDNAGSYRVGLQATNLDGSDTYLVYDYVTVPFAGCDATLPIFSSNELTVQYSPDPDDGIGGAWKYDTIITQDPAIATWSIGGLYLSSAIAGTYEFVVTQTLTFAEPVAGEILPPKPILKNLDFPKRFPDTASICDSGNWPTVWSADPIIYTARFIATANAAFTYGLIGFATNPAEESAITQAVGGTLTIGYQA